MDEVNTAIERDINNTFYMINTNMFMKRRIPSINTLDDCPKQLKDKDKGAFTSDCWKEYPEADSHPLREKDIYNPFAKILNVIVSLFFEL